MTVGAEIARAWNIAPEFISLFPSEIKQTSIKDDVAVIVVPVYSGRIPATAEASLSKIKANNVAAITVVMYGNRDYDDALLELNKTTENQGFNIVASAAFIGTHSLDQSIAAGRPNFQDLITAYNLGTNSKSKLRRIQTARCKSKRELSV